MPLPLSSIHIDLSLKYDIFIKFPKPSLASSIEFDNISKMECLNAVRAENYGRP